MRESRMQFRSYLVRTGVSVALVLAVPTIGMTGVAASPLRLDVSAAASAAKPNPGRKALAPTIQRRTAGVRDEAAKRGASDSTAGAIPLQVAHGQSVIPLRGVSAPQSHAGASVPLTTTTP